MTSDLRSSARVVTNHPISQAAAIEQSSINWKAVFAGTFASLLAYLVFMSLGIAIGSSALQGIIRGQDGASSFGWGTGIWIAFSILVSLFVGSYCAARVSGPISIRVGRVQGVVVTALFFALLLSQIGGAIGSLGRGVGSLVGAVSGMTGDLSTNPQVQDTIDQAIGDLNLKSPPGEVAQGVAVRLLRGNSEGAKNYLARQAGISTAEADQRLRTLKQNMDKVLTDVGTTAARVVSIAGWTLFGSLLLGTLFSMLGGDLGVQLNLRSPLRRSEEKTTPDQKVA